MWRHGVTIASEAPVAQVSSGDLVRGWAIRVGTAWMLSWELLKGWCPRPGEIVGLTITSTSLLLVFVKLEQNSWVRVYYKEPRFYFLQLWRLRSPRSSCVNEPSFAVIPKQGRRKGKRGGRWSWKGGFKLLWVEPVSMVIKPLPYILRAEPSCPKHLLNNMHALRLWGTHWSHSITVWFYETKGAITDLKTPLTRLE